MDWPRRLTWVQTLHKNMSMLNNNMASESTELSRKMAAQYDLDIVALHMCVLKSQVEGIASCVSQVVATVGIEYRPTHIRDSMTENPEVDLLNERRGDPDKEGTATGTPLMLRTLKPNSLSIG